MIFMNPNSTFIKLDLTFLNDLSGCDNDFIVEILDMFKDSAPQVMIDLNNFLEQKDYTAFRGVAHKFKSSVSVFGDPDLTALVCKTERTALEAPDYNELRLLTDRLTDIVQDLLNQVKGELEYRKKEVA